MWAVAVSGSGRVLWRSQLPPGAAAGMREVSPVAIGRVAVVAEGGQVFGLQLADGRRLWRWAAGEPAGLWDLVVKRAVVARTQVELAGLESATEQVRWSLRPEIGLYGDVVATSDGGLAMLTTAGVLQVVCLADGRLRWDAASGVSPAATAPGGEVLSGGVPAALAAGNGVVVFIANGHATGYDDRTGRVRWTVDDLPDQPQTLFADGLFLVTSAVPAAGQPAITAIDPGSGRVAWRFDPGVAVQPIGSGPAGLAVTDQAPAEHLYLLDPATGRPRWRARTVVAEPASLVVTATDIVAIEGSNNLRVVDRSAVNGQVRWMASAETTPEPVVKAGSLVIVQDERVSGAGAPLRAYWLASGQLAWQTDMPTRVQAVTNVPSGVLVEAGNPGAISCGSG